MTILGLFFSQQTLAQTFSPDFRDGVVYFKLRDSSNVTINGVNSLIPNTPNYDSLTVILQDSTYQIIGQVSRPFTRNYASPLNSIYLINFGDYGKIDMLIAQLQMLSYIEYAEKEPVMKISNFPPNDYNAIVQGNLDRVNALDAWNTSLPYPCTGSNGNNQIVIAIVDCAVKYDHEDLNHWINPNEIVDGQDNDGNGLIDDIFGWDFADNDNNPMPPLNTPYPNTWSHGTHCAGIAGAATDNGIGIASLAYDVQIMSLKCTEDNYPTIPIGLVGLTNTAQAINYAIEKQANIVSMSFGSPAFSQTFQTIIDDGYQNNIVFIAAAGNGNQTLISYPAAYNHVIAVAATDNNDVKAYFSNFGNGIDIAAPGVGIYSTVMTAGGNDGYANNSGTSMACPLVSSFVALLKSKYPLLTPDELETLIKNTAFDIDPNNPNYIGMLGAGRINASAAMCSEGFCSNSVSLSPIVITNPNASIFEVGQTITFQGIASTTGLSNAPFTTWWKINGVGGNLNYAMTNNLSVTDNFSYTFTEPGLYEICFYADNGEPLCRNHACIEILVLSEHSHTFTATIPTWKSDALAEMTDKSMVWVGHKFLQRMIAKIDENGQFLWKYQLTNLVNYNINNTFAQLFENASSNEVTLFSIYYKDEIAPTPDSYKLIIATFDLNTGIMQNSINHTFTVATDFKPVKVIKETDGWSLVGEAQNKIYVIKINNNEILVSAQELDNGLNVHVRDCIKTRDGGYLLGGYYGDNSSQRYAFLLKTNEAFSIKKELHQFISSYGNLGVEHLMSGEDCQSYYALVYPNFILKLDNDLNIIFTESLAGNARILNAKVNEAEQSLWVLAQYQNQTHLLSMNGSGSKNWGRRFNHTIYQNEFNSKPSLLINSENGAFLCFTKQTGLSGANAFAAYILKTDRYGFSSCDISASELEIGINPLAWDISNLFTSAISTSVVGGSFGISTPSMSPTTTLPCQYAATCNPIASFSISQRLNCDGVPPIIVNNASGYTTYSWYVNNNPVSDPNTYQYTSGSYDIKLVVSDGACTDEVIHSFVMYPATLVSTFSNTNTFPQVTFTPNSLYECAVYEWDFGDGTSSNDITPIHTYANPGLYTVCLKIMTICGQSSITCSQIQANCNLPNLIVTDAYFVSQLLIDCPSCSTGIVNQNILFLNDFAIQANAPGYTIQNSNIIMSKDKKLAFFSQNNAADITVIESNIRGCQDMWKGIEITGSGLVNINSSNISDAEYAITTLSNTDVILTDNFFDKNYIGLYVPSGLNSLPILSLSQNTFTGGTLLPHTNPAIEATAKAGMELNNMTLHIPNHTFQDLNNGILAYDCHLTVNKPTFEHIRPYSNYNVSSYLQNMNLNGSAIYLHGSNSYLADLICEGWLNPNTFTDCKYGVYTELAQTWVSHANMQQMQTGIMMVLPADQSENVIVGNTIEAEEFGIAGVITDMSRDMHIEGNAIKMNLNNNLSMGYAGIYLANFFGIASTSVATIAMNAIETNRTEHAMSIWNMTGNDNFRISNNNVALLNSNFGTKGIQVNNSDNFFMSCNSVTGQNIYNGLSYHIERSRGWDMTCNSANNSAGGFMFVNDCTSDNGFRGNDVGKHGIGLLIRSSSYFGTQKHSGNHWQIGGYGTNSALNDGNFLLSEIKVHTTQGTTYYPYQVFPLGWFVTDNGTPWADCPTNCELLSFNGVYGLNGLGKSDSLIANQGIEDSLYQAELQYSSNRYLYKKLKESTNLIPSWGAIHDFYVSQQQTSVGKFTEIKDAFTGFDASNAQIAENDSTIKGLLSQIIANDSLIETETDSAALATLHSQNKEAYNSISVLREATQALQTQIQGSHNAYIDSLKVQNTNVSSNTLVEQNERSINDIFFATIAKHNFTFSELQIAEIENIALQCPYTGGEAVYRARVLHTALTGFTAYNDSVNCAIQGINWRKGSTETVKPSIYLGVIPNPVSGEASFVLDNVLAQAVNITIYNTLGQKVQEVYIPANTLKANFEVKTWGAGIYYYQTLINQQFYEGKFIVE